MTSLGIIFTLICFLQLLVIILWRKPKMILKPHEATKATKRQVTIFLGAVILILYMLFFFQLFKYHQPHPLMNTQYSQEKVYPTPLSNTIQPLGGRQTGSISTLYFLYLSSDKSQDALTKTAFGLRQQYCKNLCIINLYDDKTAFETDIQRVKITDTAKM